jgi:glycosyltransferase involved in cell wall biosynthesis
VTIYNYFNFKKFEVGFADSKIVALTYPEKFFLVVSSNTFHKNVITVFKSFADFCKTNDASNLICVGSISGCLKDFYDQLPSNVKNRIIPLHSINNASLGYLYKKTCGYISATMFEGLGMPIVEAMYFNAPVLVSDIEVVREVSSNKAMYFSPLDYLGLSRLMKKVFFEKKKYDTQPIIKDMFSEHNTVDQYIKEINSLNK